MSSWKLVQKAKDILEKERGTIQKEWGGKITVCLLYPNSYHVGMSNLGFQTLYRILNAQDDIVCERAFLPDPEALDLYRKTQTPLFSLESQKPLSSFDILAFSVSFENDFLNVLTLLELAHLPLESRLRDGRYPWVIGGGVAVFLNPEPISEFFDLFILGEAEEVLEEFLEVWRHTLLDKRGSEKDDVLVRLSRVEGVYVPKFYRVIYGEDGRITAMEPESGFPRSVKRRWVPKLDQFPTQSALFTPDTEFRDMALVEMNRGCPRGCRFCAACFVYHPFRNRSLPLLESVSKEALLEEHRIGLTGTAVSDHPQLLPLCQSILAQQGGISLSSLRVDAITPPLVQCLKEGKERTVAIAPEAGSERLRRMVKKGYGEEEILRSVDTLVESGVSQIKCYFLIGLPGETDEDVKEILSLAKRIRHHILSSQKDGRKRWRLVLSVNPFVPKPATPFQWAPLEEVGELKKKLKMIQKGIQREGGMEMIHDLPKWAYVQALLSRGDRRVGKILMASHRHQGNWRKAFQETDINPDFYVHRRRDFNEIFPWDFIDHGIPKERLREEYVRAMEEAGVTDSGGEMG
ncbi:MAG TPA: TIGR03960 family B12-binding radical SAM protein [Thermodesulfobacteriota bacterium]|nr:TIGR03960 family B12-binding radical SAM protein [Thermodesulfobacteriota bacterium]